MIWLARTGLIRFNLQKWTDRANKFWLCTIVMNLIRDLYEIVQFIESNSLARGAKINFAAKNMRHQYTSLLKNHRGVVLDTIKNGCDLFIPMTALGYTKFKPGTIGILGLVSSAIGLYCLIDPLAKLTPA
uniref:Peroxisomal membrane protein 11B n=1 Tax=Bracon brevicornis TaxID=1563983 RepID=A0A6V7L0D7_9HYME